MANFRSIDPFDYFERRHDKKNDGRIVYSYKYENGKLKALTDPFLIIGKINGKTVAIRLVNNTSAKKIIWSENQRWQVPCTYVIDEVEENGIFKGKIDAHNIEIDIEAHDFKRTFNVDFDKWFVLKPAHDKDTIHSEDIFIDKGTFNAVISRYVSFGPTSDIAELYSFSNWEEGK